MNFDYYNLMTDPEADMQCHDCIKASKSKDSQRPKSRFAGFAAQVARLTAKIPESASAKV
jgi:hypothetical protein